MSGGTQITLAVDLMGGDLSPDVRLDALRRFKRHNPQVHLVLFATSALQNQLDEFLASERVVWCEQQVGMDESPLKTLKSKRDSTLSRAIQSLSNQQADACVSCGNTGAIVAFAKHWLRPLADIDRPALATFLPADGKKALLLDVGATLDYSADDLYHLARLGSVALSRLDADRAQPEVALLNVGVEDIKGNDAVRQADRLLSDSHLNYLGYCEGSHLFNGYADVICCDGFVGNITLKACEAMAEFLGKNKQSRRLSQWMQRLNPPRLGPQDYSGAMLLGLNGLIIKAHGNSTDDTFLQALNQAATLARGRFIQDLQTQLEQ